jgi:hypothetical protein
MGEIIFPFPFFVVDFGARMQRGVRKGYVDRDRSHFSRKRSGGAIQRKTYCTASPCSVTKSTKIFRRPPVALFK